MFLQTLTVASLLCCCQLSSSTPFKIETTEDETRIVGGVEAEPHEFPWMVRLQYKFEGYLHCGGSIISPRSILTAAHCLIDEDLADFEVVAGAHDMGNPSGERGVRQVRELKSITCHKHYGNLQNDICIIQLKTDLNMTKWVASVPLATEGTPTRENVTVAGWGRLEQGGVSPQVLRKVTIPVVSNEQCSLLYNPVQGVSITNGMMCAGTGGKSSCHGDSGGPLMCPYKSNNATVFIACGIVSFGVKCGDDRYPGVYTRISHYTKWIQGIDNSTQFLPPSVPGVAVTSTIPPQNKPSGSHGLIFSVWVVSLSGLVLAISN